MEIKARILIMNMVNNNGDLYEKVPKIVIGKPVKYNHEVIGKIISAEVKEDYIEAIAEMNDMGKKLFKEIENGK
jgi:hypothetical protein